MPQSRARRHTSQPLDLNTASIQELELFSDLGDELARRIVEYRHDHGPFHTLDELRNVSGVTRRLADELKKELKVSDK